MSSLVERLRERGEHEAADRLEEAKEMIAERDVLLMDLRRHFMWEQRRQGTSTATKNDEFLSRIDRALLSPAELKDRAVRAKEEGRG